MIAQRATFVASHGKTPQSPFRRALLDRRTSRRGAVAEEAATAIAQPRVVSNEQLPLFGTEQSEYDVMDPNVDFGDYSLVFDHVTEMPDGYWIDKVEGTVPAELHGTYFKNGPGDMNFLNEPVAHLIDANGIMASLSFKDGRAFFRSRFVKTDHSMLEEKAGRRLFRGSFGTNPKHGVVPFGMLVNRNAANGMPFLGRGRLYAAYEASPHSELDPTTLETIYPKLAGDLLPATLQVMGRQFGSMSGVAGRLDDLIGGSTKFLDPRKVIGFGDNRFDGRRGLTISQNYQPVLNPSTLSLGLEISIYEFDNSLKLLSQQKHTIDNMSMPHAVGISENYYVLSKVPMQLDLPALLNPSIGLADCVAVNPNGRHEFHLIPRPNRDGHSSRRKARVYKMPDTTFVFHYANVFEEGDKVIIDAVHHSDYPLNSRREEQVKDEASKRAVSRWRRTICHSNGKIETQELSTRCLEACTINPNYVGRDYRYAYMNVSLHPYDSFKSRAFGKVDLKSGQLDIWSKDPFNFPSEPLFVPRPDGVGEDDGWLLFSCYNAKTKKTEFVIFDARDIRQGPLATLYLNHATGQGFHGIWSHQYYGP